MLSPAKEEGRDGPEDEQACQLGDLDLAFRGIGWIGEQDAVEGSGRI